MPEDTDYLTEFHNLREELEAIRKMTSGTGGPLEAQVRLAINRMEEMLDSMIKREQKKYITIRD